MHGARGLLPTTADWRWRTIPKSLQLPVGSELGAPSCGQISHLCLVKACDKRRKNPGQVTRELRWEPAVLPPDPGVRGLACPCLCPKAARGGHFINLHPERVPRAFCLHRDTAKTKKDTMLATWKPTPRTHGHRAAGPTDAAPLASSCGWRDSGPMPPGKGGGEVCVRMRMGVAHARGF